MIVTNERHSLKYLHTTFQFLARVITRIFRASISVTEEKNEETIYHPIILSDNSRFHILLDSCYRNPTKLDTPSMNPWWNSCVSTYAYAYTYTRVCTYMYNWRILSRNNRIVIKKASRTSQFRTFSLNFLALNNVSVRQFFLVTFYFFCKKIIFASRHVSPFPCIHILKAVMSIKKLLKWTFLCNIFGLEKIDNS